MPEHGQDIAPATSTFRLRIVASADDSQTGRELPAADGLTIGRDPACAIRVAEPIVSRRQAVLAIGPDGLTITDVGGGTGVWVEGRRVTEAVLRGGQRCQIGSTIFECIELPPPPPAEDRTVLLTSPPRAEAPGKAPAPGFLVQVVEPGEQVPRGKAFTVEGSSATIGRAAECTVVIDERDVSRRHARIEMTPEGFRVTDLGSTCGVWIGQRQIQSEVVPPGQPIGIGGRVAIACAPIATHEPAEVAEVEPDATRVVPIPVPVAPPPRPAAPGPAPTPSAAAPAPAPAAAPPAPDLAAAFGETIVMPAPPDLVARTRRIEDEGELVEASAHRPFLLDDPATVWYVVTGGLLLFTVAVERGEAVGPRSHFLGILPGQCCFGFDLTRYGFGSGFLAVPKPETTLRKIPLARLQALAASGLGEAVAALIDTWIEGLTMALVHNLTVKRTDEPLLKAGTPVELGTRHKASADRGVLWVDLWSGSVLFDDMTRPIFARRRTLFPVTPNGWIQPVSEEFGTLSLSPVPTVEAVRRPELWHGLDVFHHVLCECEFVNKKLAAVDEFLRLQAKAAHADEAEAAAYDAIGSVLRAEAAAPPEFQKATATEPVLRACTLVGEAMGIEVRPHPTPGEGLTYEEMVAAVASASGFRTRVVALRDDWWRRDQGPLLGQIEATKVPVALLPTGPRSYECVDGRTGQRAPVTPELAATLSGFAYTVYRPLPDGEIGVRELVRFGARGLKRDLRWVLLMAVVVGLFGTVTPYLTGQLFDVAIPQADRGMLWGFGLALFLSALASSLFKITQGVATVRVQARMESSIQAAVWDRLLNLPASFFRKYAAGDLADRANGVDQIQELVSGAGVAAILGSVSGLFYVVQMFTYNLSLALLAILLTATYVSFNMGANYLQLRHQRVEIQLRGRIAGLVLNLISGVSKLRICGAEPHAFRVWAQQFAHQKRIGFQIGTIQSAAAVFSAIFPVLSSIAIFLVMIGEQARAAESGTSGLTTGDFIAFNAAYGLFLTAMQALGDASLNLLRIVPIYERLKPILTTRPEVDRGKAFPGRLKGRIEISHLYFRYSPDSPWIVKDLSLEINPGEFVAFVGPSGCGKSTLMRLMLGFEQPSSGTILYDGQDLASLDLRMLRQQLGVVLQVSRVMPTDIYRNIVGASSRTLDEAWDAAEKAGLAEDIRQMPMGMHTYVSEGGGTLSGGQRQRLMIARAIVNKPKVIFLDEATSALDNRTQAIVTESLDKMDATRIVIAHRLSTIINADRICYLEGGQIVEMGTYAELMAKNGKFAELARRQMA